MFRKKAWVFAFVALLIFVASSFAAADVDLVGKYKGVFTGPENYGDFLITVNPDGSIYGVGRSRVLMSDLVFEGTVSPDGMVEFYTVEGSDIPMHFNGKIDFIKRLLGKWEYRDNSGWGSFNGLIQ